MSLSCGQPEMPTVAQMNRHWTFAQTNLMLLRVLNTSDLSFMYMLYNKEAIRDILQNTSPHLDLDGFEYLTAEEKEEYQQLWNTIHDYGTSL